MKKSELQKLAKAQKEALKNRLTVTKSKGSRQSNTHIEVGTPEYSIVKYFRGAMLGRWDGAENEERLFKALGQDDATRGGFFVPPVLASGVIELLKDTAIVRRMPGVRIIPVSGTDKVQFNYVADAPTVSWGAENTEISEDTTLDFGQRTLETHKAVCLYKMSSEILANGNVNVESVVRQELADALALEEDKVFLEGTGGSRPLGIYYNPRVSSTDLSGTVGLDNLKDAEYQVRNLKSMITGWVMHPRTANDLAQLKDGQGRYMLGTGPGVFSADVTNIGGTSFAQTTQIGVTSRPSANESYIIGGRWSDFIIGDGQGLRIQTSTDRYFEYDQVALRVVKYVGSLLRHPESFAVIKGIQAS